MLIKPQALCNFCLLVGAAADRQNISSNQQQQQWGPEQHPQETGASRIFSVRSQVTGQQQLVNDMNAQIDTLDERYKKIENSYLDYGALPTKEHPVPKRVQTIASERRTEESSIEDTKATTTWKPPVPLPVKTRAFERRLQGSNSDGDTEREKPGKPAPPVPLPVKIRAFERRLDGDGETTKETSAWKKQPVPVPLPVKTRAFERNLETEKTTKTMWKQPVPLPVKTRAFERRLQTDESNHQDLQEGDDVASLEQPPSNELQRHRRLGQQKMPTTQPTPPPSTARPTTKLPTSAPSVPPTLTPTTSPSSSPMVSTPVPVAAPMALVAPTKAPFVAPIRSESPTGAPRQSPAKAPSQTPTAIKVEMVNLSSFDVVIAAVTTANLTAEQQQEQLKLYRKELRTSLQTYLADSLPYDNIAFVQLRAVPSREQRRLQQNVTVDQLYSYGGQAVFKDTAPDSADVLQQQAELLADTAAVQTAVDQSESLQGVVTVQSIEIWTNDTDRGSTIPPVASDDSSINTSTIIIGSLVAGIVFLALVLAIIVYRRLRSKDPPPPPLITTTSKQQQHVPFSPYGKEDDNMHNDDANLIVADLENLEGRWEGHGAASPRPYLQLTTSGSTSAGGDDEANCIVALAASNEDEHELMVNGTTARILSISKSSTVEEKKQEPAAKSSLYSAPVIALSNSDDSMEGFSSYSGFYGGGTRSGYSGADRELPDNATTPAAKPSWMVAPTRATAEQSAEEYTSDSESQFSCEKNTALASGLTTLGPALNSMSMDSADSSVDELMPSLRDTNGRYAAKSGISGAGRGLPQDQPTPAAKPSWMIAPKSSEQSAEEYSSDSESQMYFYENVGTAPSTGLSTLGPALNSMSMDSADSSRDELMPSLKVKNDSGEFSYDDDDFEDPLRAAALSPLVSSSNNIASLNTSASSGTLTPKSTKGTVLSSPDRDSSDAVSQPSDEMMEDSMAQDLEGFAEELAKIKRDIGLSIGKNPDVMTSPLVTSSRLQTAPSDEFGANTVTPEDESKGALKNRRRR